MANWALCNPEDQSSDLQHPHDEPSIATHTHIHTHSVDVAEMGGTLGLAGQMGESGSMRDRPKNRVESDEEDTGWNLASSLCVPQHHIQMQTYTQYPVFTNLLVFYHDAT